MGIHKSLVLIKQQPTPDIRAVFEDLAGPSRSNVTNDIWSGRSSVLFDLLYGEPTKTESGVRQVYDPRYLKFLETPVSNTSSRERWHIMFFNCRR
jgi:hypothetical protein